MASVVQNTEMREEKKSSENVNNTNNNQSLSPERRSKIDNYESSSPQRKQENVEEEKNQIVEERKPKPKKIKAIEPPSGLIIESSNPSSYRKQSLDNSLNDIYEKDSKKSQLPTIKLYNNNNKSDYEYSTKPEIKKEKKYNHSLERDYRHKVNHDLGLNGSNSIGNIHGSNQKLIKILPYVYNEHISNVYKNQNPYQNPPIVNKYDKKGYVKAGYDYKPKKMNLDSSLNHGKKLPIIPNRKLSPIRKQILKA